MDLNAELDHLADMPESHSSPSFTSSESPEPSGAHVVRHDNEDCVDKGLMLKLQRLDLTQPDSRFFGGSRSVVRCGARKNLILGLQKWISTYSDCP